MAEDVAHVDAEHLAILQVVEGIAPGGVALGSVALRSVTRGGVGLGSVALGSVTLGGGGEGGAVEDGVELGLELGPGLGGVQGVDVAHDGKEVVVLHAQKVVPQKVTDAEEAGQRAEHLGTLERGELVGPVGAAEELGDELPKVGQGGGGVGEGGEEVGKVLDQDGGGAQLALLRGGGDLEPLGVGDVEGVVGAAGGGGDVDAGDIDAAEGEGVGELEEKADGVGGRDAQHGVLVRRGVVEVDLDRVERLGASIDVLQGGGDAVDELAVRFCRAALLEEMEEGLKLVVIAEEGRC